MYSLLSVLPMEYMHIHVLEVKGGHQIISFDNITVVPSSSHFAIKHVCLSWTHTTNFLPFKVLRMTQVEKLRLHSSVNCILVKIHVYNISSVLNVCIDGVSYSSVCW